MTKIKSIEEQYKKLTQREHVLHRPDTYISSIIIEDRDAWCVNDINNLQNIKITKQSIRYIPAFLKIFDEILTNASDHALRKNSGVKNIKINITKDFRISVWNDGSGIPIQMHKEHNIYVPELIFGHLLTGSNYDDTEDRISAGKNGIGAKATNIFSKEFIINCADGKKSYYQVFSDNMSKILPPKIKDSSKSYTEISYIPDFTRFDIKGIEEDTLKVIIKRIVDVAAYIPKVKVYYNDTLIQINSIQDWAKLHLKEESELFSEKVNDMWELCLAQADKDNFEQCSIVNGNTTYRGGTHVDFIMNQVVKRLINDLTKGNKGIKIKPSDIKNKFHLFLISKIINPSFDSQTKETLSTKINETFELSDKLYKQLLKSEIIESILEWVSMKEQMELNKMNKKAAGKTLRIEKLHDAHKAGTDEGYKAKLFLVEGDSALNSCLSGIGAIGKEYLGAFPLKGKPLNVRDVKISKITENAEIQKIMQIIGLVPGKKYTSVAELRYGQVVFFSDNDFDGYSIRGLLINLFHTFWPELLDLGFCYEFITPIVRAKKGNHVIDYYDQNKYLNDKNLEKLNGYYCKYYKGLGTITPVEIKEMFKNIDKHLINFKYIEDRDSDKIDMLFRKDRVEHRKEWILDTYAGEIVPDKFGKPNQIKDFIDKEFIQFSNYDNIRSIPNTIDGLKPSQRKIMYSGFKKLGKIEREELKVEQFANYTAEQTHYAHGSNNLMGAIVNMAQDFVGSNNINLLMPSGQFGSRSNPSGSASPRYIFTYLNPLTELIFRKEDEPILNYKKEEDYNIEPEFYLPIIPTILVNGADGIGTGWSTSIPHYNPLSIIKILKKKLENPKQKYSIIPDYKGFNGEINYDKEKNIYITKGIYSKTKKGVIISELPINIWTEDYINFLDKLCDDKKIRNYVDNSTDNTVNIEVQLYDDTKDIEIESLLKLTSNLSMNNIHAFLDNKIIKWEGAEEIINKWFDIRLDYYAKRKKSWTDELTHKYNKYNAIYEFIKSVIDEKLLINNRKKDIIIKDLEKLKFYKINDNFDYLLNIPVYHFTKEKFEEYRQNSLDAKKELSEYKKLKPEEIWETDLTELENALKKLNIY